MRRFLLSLILLLSLAGCAGPSAVRSPGSLEAAAADERAAQLEGIVEGPLGLPLAGAGLLLEPSALTATTDELGRFAFPPLDAGDYSLRASQPGFAPHVHALRLAPGSITRVTLSLAPLETDAPARIETTAFTGFVQCSANAGYTSNACGALLGTSKDRLRIHVDPAGHARELLFELVWDPATPATGQQLSLDVCAPGGSGATGLHCADAALDDGFHRSASGGPPVTLSIPADDLPEEVDAWVGTGRFSAEPAIAQSFTLYATTCFFVACPPGFTAVS